MDKKQKISKTTMRHNYYGIRTVQLLQNIRMTWNTFREKE